MKYAELSHAAKSLAESARALLRGDARAEARRVQSLSQEVLSLVDRPSRSLVGHSPGWRQVVQAIELAASQTAPIFFWGERGTGKTLAARALHELTGAPQPLTILDAESTPASVIDAALSKPGPFVLKNVDLLSADRFTRAASRKRTMLTSRKKLADAIYFPALRERREDIPALLYHFIGRSKKVTRFDRPALERLLRHPYPGNVGELEAIVDRILLVAEGPLVGLYDLPEELRQGTGPMPAASIRTAQELRQAKREARELVERHFLVEALRRAGGKVTLAARETGVHRTRLAQLMTKFKIRLSDFRPKK
jgi:DNA-binding NtrC family response regulator